MKMTFQPKKRQRSKVHGFRATAAGIFPDAKQKEVP